MSTDIRVLMVEDNEDDALLTLRELRNAGYEVEHLRVETELALRTALQQGAWDLVIVDYNLPQLTGLKTLALVRAHDTGPPAIVVSGTIGEDVAADCMRAGAHDYVMKDNLKRLGPAVARELAEFENRRSATLQRERTARIIDAADTLIVGCDRDGRMTTFNRKCEKMTGWSRDDVIGRPVAELASGNDWLTSALGTFDEGRDYGSVTDFEHPLVDANGRDRVITWYPAPILDDDGAIVEIVAIGMDITAQLAAEQQYRTLIDTMGDGLNVIDLSGRMTYANEALCDMLEYDLGELIAKPLTDLCDGENCALLEAQLTERFETGAPAEYELNYRAKSGRQVPVLVSAAALHNSADVIVGAFAVVKDMTAYKQAEADLKASEASLRTVLSAVPTGIGLVCDRVFGWVNEGMTAMSGYSEGELLGESARMVYDSDEEYERVGDVMHDQVQRTGVGQMGTYWRRKDGEIIDVHLRASTVDREDPSAGSIFTAMDITEHRLLEEQLHQAQKMEAIGQLAGGVAHDFNNLLTAILGNTELLSRELSELEGLTEYTDEVLKAGRRAVGLTRQLLAFSRKQVLEPEILDLNEVTADLVPMLRRLIEENIELVTHPGADLHSIEADPGQVEQIIINLVVNARDAMRDGGTLSIETSNVNLDEEYVRLHWDAAVGPHVMLAISDTGTGMDEHVMEHIFEPFFTTKDEGEGTGLGLATVHGIVKQSGGSIHVYSEPGEGTTFRVYFPRVKSDTDAAVEEPKAETTLGGAETILVVEDEEMVRELIVRVIAAQGYNVLVADNGQEALTVFENATEPIDLMVTDVIMPGMSGDELAELAKQLAPELKVIFLSGYTANAIASRGILEPGVHLVQKPFEPDALLAKIREVLDEPTEALEES